MPILLSHLKVSDPELESFLWLRSFRGSKKQERKNDYNSTILGARNKVRSKLYMRKTNGFFLFNKFVQNLIFFHLQIKKIGFITLVLDRF